MTETHDPSQAELDALRANLDEKLAELKRRATHAKVVLTPATYLDDPWVRCGIAALLGFAIGSGSQRALLRTGLGIAGVLVAHQLLAHAATRSDDE